MSMNDPISDMLTRIRNANQVGKSDVSMPSSKMKLAISRVLKDEGYIDSFETKNVNNGKLNLKIFLKYYSGRPVIGQIKRVSRPGLRIYKSVSLIPNVMNGLGIAVISTPHGVISDKKARSYHIGGEVICYVS